MPKTIRSATLRIEPYQLTQPEIERFCRIIFKQTGFEE